MTQPTPYTRLYDFSDFQTVNPTRPLPGSQVDSELDAVKLTTDQLRQNIALIQRDDGKLANQAVTPESLSAGALAMIHQGEYAPKGAWAAATSYALGDVIDFNGATFLAIIAGTSSVSFANDKTAGRWLLIANGALQGASQAVDLFTGNGTQTAFTLSFSYSGNTAATVFVGGVAQIPGEDFTLVGSALTLVTAPPAPSVAGRKNVMVRGPAVDAQLAADAATTQAANAAGSATASANSATASASSAAASAASAATAATQATTATTQATAASSSATSAATSAATATTQATNSATSATSSSTSAQLANDWAAKTGSAVAGGEFSAKHHAQQSATSATASGTSAANSATSATASASSATAAASSAASAANSATTAQSAQTAAEAARDQTLASFDSFDDRYLGAKTADPTVDNDGNALAAGSLYFNSTAGVMKVYTGTGWVSAYVSGTDFLPLTGGTLTGAVTFAAGQSFPGTGNVTTTGTQTLTNKTLTAPVINSPTGLVKGDVGLSNVDNTSDATKNSATATLTNKTLTNPVINGGTIDGEQIGFRDIPISGSEKTSSYSLAASDVGKFIQVGTGGSITIPNSVFAAGDAISIFNNTSGNVTITCSINTAYKAGADVDQATVTLQTRGLATVLFISSTVCVISGNLA